MAHNEQQNKKTKGGGPQGHPSNQGPAKRGNQGGGRGDGAPGGNKVAQGRGADTGNKGKR